MCKGSGHPVEMAHSSGVARLRGLWGRWLLPAVTGSYLPKLEKSRGFAVHFTAKTFCSTGEGLANSGGCGGPGEPCS